METAFWLKASITFMTELDYFSKSFEQNNPHV